MWRKVCFPSPRSGGMIQSLITIRRTLAYGTRNDQRFLTASCIQDRVLGASSERVIHSHVRLQGKQRQRFAQLRGWNAATTGNDWASSASHVQQRFVFSTMSSDDTSNGETTIEAPQAVEEVYFQARRKGMRCLAIVAHVDHGKTTLVDRLLQASASTMKPVVSSGGGAGTDNASPTEEEEPLPVANSATERLLDSGDLEKERGITITSKVTRVMYQPRSTGGEGEIQSSPVIINLADSPGHADFSAEVDRILGVTDGFLLVVDIVEGPKSQTKYVLTRALALGLNPIVVLNKCDRPEAASKIDSGDTEVKIMDLFVALGATEQQLTYPTIYASARQGWATNDPLRAMELSETADKMTHIPADCRMSLLLDTILEKIPEPSVRIYSPDPSEGENSSSSSASIPSFPAEAFRNDKFSLAAVSVGMDPYLGRTCSGRIMSGSVGHNDKVTVLQRISKEPNRLTEQTPQLAATTNSGATASTNVTGVFVYRGIHRVPLDDDRAYAGDYVTIAGVADMIAVGDTVTGSKNPVAQPVNTPPLAPPTLSMDFAANDGPLAGQEGKMLSSAHIRDRLLSETDNNVTLKVTPHPVETDKTVVYARGELQLGILVEQMRREGYEILISPPRIITRTCPETGTVFEPYEEVIVDVDSDYAGAVVNILTSGERKGLLKEMSSGTHDGKSQLIFEMPSRGLLAGFRSELATATRGSAVVNHIFIGDREQVGPTASLDQKGKLVSNESGKATAYALSSLEARGILFVEPGDQVYPGMVIGENAKPGDLEVNPIRAKEKTNMRTKAKDEGIQLSPPKRMSVEELIAYMSPDEMIEVTPTNVRLRKQLLDSGARERAARTKAKQLRALKEK